MRISVIVPMLNEAERIAAQLQHLKEQDPHELIVVDGGSDDGSCEIATELADQVLSCEEGLAAQLNAGAEVATGDVFAFVYADTRLPDGSGTVIATTLADEGTIAGAFRLALDDPRWRYRFTAFAANLRSSAGWGPFGDQAIFVRAEAFQRVGGYRADVLLEDLDLVRRLRKIGKVKVATTSALSSVRRWESGGFGATMVRNWKYLACHILGMRGGGVRQRYQNYRGG